MRIYIEDMDRGKHIAQDVRVYVVQDLEDGTERRIDISDLVRNAEIRLPLGEIVTARLECMIGGYTGYAEVEELLLHERQKLEAA